MTLDEVSWHVSLGEDAHIPSREDPPTFHFIITEHCESRIWDNHNIGVINDIIKGEKQKPQGPFMFFICNWSIGELSICDLLGNWVYEIILIYFELWHWYRACLICLRINLHSEGSEDVKIIFEWNKVNILLILFPYGGVQSSWQVATCWSVDPNGLPHTTQMS